MSNKEWIEMTIATLSKDCVMFQEWKMQHIRRALKRAIARGQKGAAQ